MRLRARPSAAEPSNDLSKVETDELISALGQRGFDVAPVGAVRDIEARAEKFEAVALCAINELKRLSASGNRVDEALESGRLIDASAKFDEVLDLVGTTLPEAVRVAGGLMDENTDLRARANRSEQEASRLAKVIIGEEFPESRSDE